MQETMTLANHLEQDALDDAIAAATSRVKTAATDAGARLDLAELCVLAGDLARAETHAKLSTTLSPDDVIGLGVFRQHLRGMYARQHWWTDGAAPAFPMGPTPCDEAALKINVALRSGDAETAKTALQTLDAERGSRPAVWNGKAVDDLRDLDDRLPHAVEAITAGGNYLWLDMALIQKISFKPPARPIDLAYRRARITLTDGAAADLLVPAVYWGATTNADKLARHTGFADLPGGLTAASGQRAYLAGDEMVGLLAAKTIVFGA